MTLVDTRPAEPDPDHPDRLATIDDVADDDYGGELVLPEPAEVDPWAPIPGRNALERFAHRPLPTLIGMRMSATWWTWTLTRASLNLVTHAPQLGVYQIPHIFRGLAMWAARYAEWRAQPEWMAAAKIAEPKDRAKEMHKVRRRQIAHARMTWLAVALAIAGAIYLLRQPWGWAYLAGIVFAVIVRLDVVGRKGAPVSAPTVEVMPRSAFREGAPTRMVVEDVHAVLTEQGYDPERTAVVEPKVGQYGLSMTIHTPQEIHEGVPEAIERGLQTFRGAVSILADPDNAALHELRVFWRDPLAFSVTPCRYAPNQLTIGVPAVMGYGVGNVALELSFMRVNMIIIGGPGSGKSSTLWTATDYLSACRDVELLGIDLSGGPALHAWGESREECTCDGVTDRSRCEHHVFAKIATTRDEAKALLEEEIARCIERTKLLAARSRPRPDMPTPESENWEPEDAEAGRGLFRIIIIDELPLLSNDKELVALYSEHQRIGRKAGQTSVAAAQDLSGETLGATSLRKYPSTVILHACSREDVTTALGKGAVAQGWAPHRLTPAEGGAVNDAGKAYVKSGRYNRPTPWRMARLELGEVHDRAIERIEAGRPVDGQPVESVVEATVIPPILAALTAVFAAAGNPEFMPTDDLLAALNDLGHKLSDVKLSAEVKKFKVGPKPDDGPAPTLGSTRQRWGGANVRGYRLADIQAAKDLI